jgi:YihY family inner membrane protein
VNPATRTLQQVDEYQQRHTPLGFVFGLTKKYGDDNGGVLVANLAYTSFVTLFPLLLVMVTVLGIVAAHDPSFRDSVKSAVAGQFPQIGTQLTNINALQKSSIIGLVIGVVTLIWGATGLAQAGLFTMAQVWNVPGPARLKYVPRLLRSLMFLGLLGGGVLLTTGLASLGSFVHKAFIFAVLAEILAALVNVAVYFGAFRVLTIPAVPSKKLLPGAVVGGILWTIVQAVGGYLVHHFESGDSVYGALFAPVLGLLAYIFLGVQITVYCAEINVVLARRLWPRALKAPPLTEADRSAMALQALQNQRRPEQHVDVSYDDRPEGEEPGELTPQTPEDVSPPADPDEVRAAAAARDLEQAEAQAEARAEAQRAAEEEARAAEEERASQPSRRGPASRLVSAVTAPFRSR